MCINITETPTVPSTHTKCGTCDQELWVSDTMRPRVDSGEILPCCTWCMIKSAMEIDGFAIAPEQRAELEEMGILSEVETGIRQLNQNIDERKNRG